MLGERWGVTRQETARHFPVDDLVPEPAVVVWRGVTVAAPAAAVWPWVCQLQLAPYSYDWLDNLGRRSPRELVGRPEPEPGQRFSCIGGRFAVGRVLAVAHEQHLTAEILGAVMCYLLVPQGDATRLLLKVVLPRRRWYGPALAVGDWPMARRQLLNLKALAEHSRR